MVYRKPDSKKVNGSGQNRAIILVNIVPVLTMSMGNWFFKQRSMLTGLVMSCSGIVGAVMSPVLSKVIAEQGYQAGYILCAVLMVLFCAPALFTLTVSPQKASMTPYGAGEVDPDAETKAKTREGSPLRCYSALFIVMLCIAFFSQSICSIAQHLSGYGQASGHSAAVSAMMISAAMIGNLAAKFLVGVLCDMIGELRGAAVLLSAIALGVACLFFFPGSKLLLYVGSLLLGTSYACALMMSILTFYVYGRQAVWKRLFYMICLTVIHPFCWEQQLCLYWYWFCFYCSPS